MEGGGESICWISYEFLLSYYFLLYYVGCDTMQKLIYPQLNIVGRDIFRCRRELGDITPGCVEVGVVEDGIQGDDFESRSTILVERKKQEMIFDGRLGNYYQCWSKDSSVEDML